MCIKKRAENGQEIKQNFKYMQDENSLSLENAACRRRSRCCCSCWRQKQKGSSKKKYDSQLYELYVGYG